MSRGLKALADSGVCLLRMVSVVATAEHTDEAYLPGDDVQSILCKLGLFDDGFFPTFLATSSSTSASESYPPSSGLLSLRRSFLKSAFVTLSWRFGPCLGILTTVSGCPLTASFGVSSPSNGTPDEFLVRSFENFRLINACTLFILCRLCKLYIEGREKRMRLGAFAGDLSFEPECLALSKISRSSWRSSVLALVKREPCEPWLLRSNGRFTGVASLTRILGSSGDDDRSSCSPVQHSLDAIFWT